MKQQMLEKEVVKLKKQVIDLINQNAELIKDQTELRTHLAWFIKEDDTRDEPGNSYWAQGLEDAKKAMAKSLGEPYEKGEWDILENPPLPTRRICI